MSDRRERMEGAGVFTARVRDGAIAVPPGVREALGLPDGTHVVVRLSPAGETAALRRRGITEEEVERISLLQGEPRSRVVRFLLAEGAAVRRRAGRARR